MRCFPTTLLLMMIIGITAAWQLHGHRAGLVVSAHLMQRVQALTPLPSFLPPETGAILTTVRRGEPFPYHHDGIALGDYEHRPSARSRNHYHATTVPAPSFRTGGAHRITAVDRHHGLRSFNAPP